MIKKFMKLSLTALLAYTAITPAKSMDDLEDRQYIVNAQLDAHATLNSILPEPQTTFYHAIQKSYR